MIKWRRSIMAEGGEYLGVFFFIKRLITLGEIHAIVETCKAFVYQMSRQ